MIPAPIFNFKATAFRLDNVTYDGVEFNMRDDITTSEVNMPVFRPDGTRMFMTDAQLSSDKVHYWDLSTAWELSTATYVGELVDGTNTSPPLQNVQFNNDGTKIFIQRDSQIYEASLSGAYGGTETILDLRSIGTNVQSFWFDDDGDRLFYAYGSSAPFTIAERTLSTAYDISTMGAATDRGTIPRGITTATRFGTGLLVGQTLGTLTEYRMSAYDYSSPTSFETWALNTSATWALYSGDGRKVYARSGTSTIKQYSTTA